jgi:hypothetical protein
MRSLALILALVMTGAVSAGEEKAAQEAFKKDAQAAIKELATSLKSSLLAAMGDGGPAEAVSVCNLIAPSLAAEISKKYGLEIGRTSLKVRNPANEADAWETDVLQRFETRLAGGEAIQKLTFKEKVETASGSQWRMMKAIPTDKVCLSCHGSKIAEPVQARIDTHYPDDMATGFKLGDIRGAFTVKRDIVD